MAISHKPEKSVPRLFISYGNPGKRYAQTFGNIAFLFADFVHFRAINILPTQAARMWVNKSKYQLCVITNDPLALLIKPRVFTKDFDNLARDLFRYYHPPPEEFYVIYPDPGLKLGQYKVDQRRGRFAPPNVQKLAREIETDNFIKIKLGIPNKNYDSIFSTDELGEVKTMSYKLGIDLKIIPRLGEPL